MVAESSVPIAAPIFLSMPQNVNGVDRQSERGRLEKLFPKKTILVCSILQLICAGVAAMTQVIIPFGCAMFINILKKLTKNNFLQVILIAVDSYRGPRVTVVGTGIWTGVLFGVAGGLGLNASQRPSYCS